MSDKIWHGLLIFVLIGKTIEYSINYISGIKIKKIRTQKNKF